MLTLTKFEKEVGSKLIFLRRVNGFEERSGDVSGEARCHLRQLKSF